MLFEKLLDAITAIIELIVRLLLFLLKVLGLWIPAIYSLLFILLCAIFQIDFSQVLAIYLVGLAVSLIFTFYIIFLRVMSAKRRRYKKREEKRAKGKERKKSAKTEDRSKDEKEQKEAKTEAQPVQTPEVPPVAEQPTPVQMQPQTYQPYQNPAYPTANVGSGEMQSYPPLQINDVPPQYVSPSESERPQMTSSKPLIFRTRMDPNLLIYEYSDRLVFYRKTLNGLEHVKTERKNPIR